MALPRQSKFQAVDFPLAPMIDMVFLLIVFFMCVSNWAQAEKQLELKLPLSKESSTEEDWNSQATVSIDANGTCYVGISQIEAETLSKRLKEATAKNPDFVINIRADRQTAYRHIRKVMQICGDAGIGQILYATYKE